jgi:hypothetical protein
LANAHGQQSLKFELEAVPEQVLAPVLVRLRSPTAASAFVGFAVSMMHSLTLELEGHTAAEIQ